MTLENDDNIEMFFMPNPQSGKYCHLVFNVGGTKLDLLPIPGPGGAPVNYLRWNPDWQVKIKIDANRGWSAEVFLPWAVFSGEQFKELSSPADAGAQWRAFVGRSRRQMEYSGLVWVESFHNIKRYPTLKFE